MNSPHKGQWRGALMFSLICALNKRLRKQSWGWWFTTPSCPLWRHCSGPTSRWVMQAHQYLTGLLSYNPRQDSNGSWANVGPMSGRQYRRWADVHCCLGYCWKCGDMLHFFQSLLNKFYHDTSYLKYLLLCIHSVVSSFGTDGLRFMSTHN